jgi:putative acetyltransferase
MESAPVIDLTIVDPRGEIAAKLMRALAEEEARRYHDLGADTFDAFLPEDVLVPRGAFVLARADGAPAGCGALRPIDADTAEINRMYVEPTARRKGVGRAILAELERLASGFGYQILRLETGNRQPEAIALYEGHGFRPAAAFGAHSSDPVSIFFEKMLKDGGR